MKVNFTSLIFAFFLFSSIQLSAQEDKDSGLWTNGLTAKVLFIDYGNPNSNDALNISNGLEVAYVRNIAPFLNFAVPLKIGVGNIVSNENKTTFFGIDGHLQIQYFKEGNKLIPYVLGGIGYVNEVDGLSNAQIPLGAGLNYKISQGGYVTLQFEYRKSLEEARDNLQLGLGWHFRLGKGDLSSLDSDGDGVFDSTDNCPKIPGKKTAYGCPDSDDDGIPDGGDECPTEAGLAKFNGCPDSDGDGIPNQNDECPNEAGLLEDKGCPVLIIDTDGDGFIDENDDCPETIGTIRGCPDSDKDGFADSVDDCPNAAGKIKGCPDTDGDGILDKDDKCPNDYGELKRKGCPMQDSDGDGIMDDKDECPQVAGKQLLKGCPDTDGDGLADNHDKCPNAAGSRDNDGCPDTDGDGLADNVDDCPNERGPSKNKGCPEITVEDKATLDVAMRAVQFESGSANFKAESYAILNQLVEVMNRYPDYNLRINGYTDDVGLDVNNLRLSKDRAFVCREYLKSKGISVFRLADEGFGETKPIAPNDTIEGRKLNRRVEFELVFK